MMQHSDIFEDLFVLELASALAGPSVGMFFAELGARVVKIENALTGGDVTRKWKHPSEKSEDPYSAYYYSTNWNKESVLMDLTDPENKQTLQSLVKGADIVVSNFKKGSAIKLGMDYESLRPINPSIIYASVNAYGKDDPRPGFDAILQAETGWMSINGSADGPPTKMPLPLIDILAGHQMKQGILVALLKCYKTGIGCEVSVSLYDAAISALTNQASTFLNLDITPTRNGSRHPSISPYGDTVQTSDVQYFLLGIGTNEQFEDLCTLLKLSDLPKDKKYLNNQQRLLHRDNLMKLLQEEIMKLNAEQFLSGCEQFKIPVAPIRNINEVFSDDQAERLIIEEVINGKNSKRVKTVVFQLDKRTSEK